MGKNETTTRDGNLFAAMLGILLDSPFGKIFKASLVGSLISAVGVTAGILLWIFSSWKLGVTVIVLSLLAEVVILGLSAIRAFKGIGKPKKRSSQDSLFDDVDTAFGAIRDDDSSLFDGSTRRPARPTAPRPPARPARPTPAPQPSAFTTPDTGSGTDGVTLHKSDSGSSGHDHGGSSHGGHDHGGGTD